MSSLFSRISRGVAAMAALAAFSPTAQAETLILGTPTALYTFDTASSSTTPFATARGSVQGWPAARPLRRTPDGALVCTADSAGPVCYDSTTGAQKGAVNTSFSAPYAWDVSQSGDRLVSAAMITGAQGTTGPGLRIINASTGQDIATVGLETYAVAISPAGNTATVLAFDISDPQGAFLQKTPLMLATVNIENGALVKSVPLKDSTGARVYGPWKLYGLADTGGGKFVVWNGEASSSVLTFGADGILQHRVAVTAAQNVVLSKDGTVAYAANGQRAQQVAIATGQVTWDYVDTQTTGLSIAATGDRLFTVGPLGGLPSSAILTWSIATGSLAVRQAASDPGITSVAAVPPARQLALPETGWWWSSSAAGTGFSIECSASNSRCFIGDFTYSATGEAVWYVTSCALSATNTCTGTIDEYRGGITLGGGPQAPTGVAGAAGTMSIAFTSSTTATVSVTGRAPFEISRFPINGTAISAPPTFAPQNGWWWAANEAGRGWFIESQNSVPQAGTTYSQLYVAGYMYETNGRPVWYLAQGLYTAVGTFGGSIPLFDGSLGEFAGGPPLTGGAGSGLTVAGARGTVTIQFTSAVAGTIRLPNGRSVAITRFPVP